MSLWMAGIAWAAPAVLRVDVTGATSRVGTIRCQLFDRADGFPETGALARVDGTWTDAGATCRFDDLPPGTYAVSVLHDADDDGKMAKSWVGIPLEGYGVSNAATRRLGPPRFHACTFVHPTAQGGPVVVPLVY